MDKTPHSQKRYLVRYTNQAIKLLSLKPTALVLCAFQLLPDSTVQQNLLYSKLLEIQATQGMPWEMRQARCYAILKYQGDEVAKLTCG